MHHKKRGQQVEGGDSVALLCFCETPPECCVQLWGSHSKKNVDLLERGLRRAMKMLRGLERLRVLGLKNSRLKKRRLQEDLKVPSGT